MISRLDFRYPSQFGENGTLRAVKELAADDSTVNQDQEPIIPDRTVNYRKCILPFVLGVALMLAGIIMRKLCLAIPTKRVLQCKRPNLSTRKRANQTWI